jgi:hypothetical protein
VVTFFVSSETEDSPRGAEKFARKSMSKKSAAEKNRSLAGFDPLTVYSFLHSLEQLFSSIAGVKAVRPLHHHDPCVPPLLDQTPRLGESRCGSEPSEFVL